ncbi:hypothetical protein H7J07_06000 [Mycobacterium koreense]|uniref:Uncharacterized protein n=1 Tax=Mycolicibacillus koreensis TaxID=1069220 RepID=A0AA91PG42_9MYCO|nr:hypothetical protein [Mycolicibacillus koreensis]MCV7247779.1 hypothetical protein [Mycolicibacillus koreensis]OSC34704.1 hypothetical protein B8W67_05500 [Mycolicibacillus koreensis]
MIEAAEPGQPGSPMTKDLARRVAAQTDRTRRQLERMHSDTARKAHAASANGYDPSRPNRFMHDSLGDPYTCTGDHNHPQHIGE